VVTTIIVGPADRVTGQNIELVMTK
jgi:hypothetical protein